MFARQQAELSAELKRLTGVKKLGSLLNTASRQIAITEFEGKLAYVRGNPLNQIDIWDFALSKLVYCFDSAHDGRIYSIVATSDHKFILSGSEDNSIALWNLKEKKLAFRFEDAHERAITKLVVSNNNKFVISASLDRSIAIWDLEEKKLVHRFVNAHIDDIWTLSITADDKYVISAGEDQIIAIWNITTKRNLCRIVEAHSKAIIAVAVSSNNKYIISAAEDETICVWDFETKELLNKFEDEESAGISSLAVSQNSGYLYCGYKSGEFIVRDLEGKEPAKTYSTEYETADSPICQILPSSYINYLATSSLNGDVLFWSLSSGEPTISKIFQHGQTEFNGIKVTSDSKKIVSISKKTIFVWDFKERKLIHITRASGDEELVGLTLTPDNEQIIVATSDHSVGAWNLRDLTQTVNIEITWSVWNLRKVLLEVTSDGESIIYAAPAENFISILSLAEKKVVAKLEQQNVISLAISRDSRYLVAGTEDNRILIWDLPNKKLFRKYDEPTQNWVLSVRFTSEDLLVSSAWGGNISLWDYKNLDKQEPLHSTNVKDVLPYIETVGNSIVWVGSDSNLKRLELKDLAQQEGDSLQKWTKFTSRSIYSNNLAVTSENKYLIAGTTERIEIWDMDNSSFVSGCDDLSLHFRYTFDVSSDSKLLICSTIGNSIDVWDIPSKTLLHRFEKAHNMPILSLSVSKYGHYLIASGCADGSVSIWDPKKKELVSTILNAHSSAIIGIKLSQDSSKLITLSSDTLTVWRLSDESQICSFSAQPESTFIKFDTSKNFRYVATANSNGSVSVFDIQEKSEVYSIPDAHTQSASAVLFTYDARQLISCSEDKSIAVWDFQTKTLVHRLHRPHSDTVTTFALDSNNHLYSASASGSIKVWDTDSWSLLYRNTVIHNKKIELLKVTNDDKLLLSLSVDGTIGLLNLKEDPIITTIPTKHHEPVRCFAISKDNAFFATANGENIKIFDFYQKVEIADFKQAHKDWIRTLVLTDDSKYLISCSVDKSVAVWDMTGMKLHYRFDRIHQDEINWFTLFPDNRTVATASGDRTIAIIDIIDKKVVTTIMNAHKESISRVAVTSDMTYIVSAASDFTIAIWKRARGEYVLVRGFNYPAPRFGNIEFLGITENNRHIICSDLESIKVWDFEQEEDEPPKELETCLERRMHTLGLSTNRRYLIGSSAEDRSIVIWDLSQSICVYHSRASNLSTIGCIQLSHDLRYLLYISQKDNSVVVNKSSFLINSRKLQKFRIPLLRAVDCYFNPGMYTTEEITSAISALVDCYHLPKGWNYLNFIVFLLPDLDASFLDIAIENKVSLTFDAYNKTQLDYILDYTDDRTTQVQKFYSYFFKNLRTFMNLNVVDPEKLLLSMSDNLIMIHETQSEASFLNYLSCFAISPEKHYKNFELLPIEGEIKGGREKDYTQIASLAYNEEETRQLVTKKGKATLAYSLLALPLSFSIYSEDTLSLIRIFRSVEDITFFQSPTVRDLIGLYWKKAQVLLWMLFALQLIPAALFTACVLLRNSNSELANDLLYGVVTCNVIQLFFELLQLSVNPKEYFRNFANIVELIIIAIQFGNAGIFWGDQSVDFVSFSISLSTILWYSKLLVMLRMIAQLRKFIRMIIEICYACLSFLGVLLIAIAAFTVAIYQAREAEGAEDTSFWSVALEIYVFSLGYFDQTLYTGITMPVFILATIVLALILLNVLIALMWDIYEQVRDNSIPIDSRERLSMVTEVVAKTIQLHRLWNRITGSREGPRKSYLLIVEPYRTIEKSVEVDQLIEGQTSKIHSVQDHLTYGVNALKAEVRTDIEMMKTEITNVKADLKSEISSIKEELGSIADWVKKNVKSG